MQQIVLIVFILTSYAILAGIIYAVFKKLGVPEGVKEAFAMCFPLGIPILIFAFITRCTYKLVYKIFKWE
jgi:hypothetical protein